MKRIAAFWLILSLAVAAGAETNGLGIARAALRDGLWAIARNHVGTNSGDRGRLVILESYAREKRWGDVALTLRGWPDATNGLFACYGAAAEAEAGRGAEAIAVLDSASFTNAVLKRLAARIRAKVAADAGHPADAARQVAEAGFDGGDFDGKAYLADLRAASGDRAAAEKIWREILAAAPVGESAYVTAAANLGDATALSNAYRRVASADMRRLCGLRLGLVLMATPKTFSEGARIVRAIAKDTPDCEGAFDASVILADRLLAAGRWQEAVDAYRDVLETWPKAARIAAVHDGHGWALSKLGRAEEALHAFRRAEEVATEEGARAAAAMKQGDILAETGRGAESMAKYREVLTRYPKTPVAQKLARIVRIRECESQGREAFSAGDYATAEKSFAEVSSADPARSVRMDYLTALCRFGLGFDEDAVAQMERLSADAKDAAVRRAATLWLAKRNYNLGSWKNAVRLFTAVAQGDAPPAVAADALLWSARAAFSDGDYKLAVQTATDLVARHPSAPGRVAALLIQGEALVELARFDEAVLVLGRVAESAQAMSTERDRAQILAADALYALGADDTSRYRQALEAYGRVLAGGALTPNERLQIAYKEARTLERLKRTEEALDRYYTRVVIAFRDGREKGVRYDDEAQAAFARAAFRLADEYEGQGRDFQAKSVLELVATSGVPAAAEASRRIVRLSEKGRFL